MKNKFRFGVIRESADMSVLRIIPHQSVENNTNRHFVHMLHDLFQSAERRWKMKVRDGIQIIIRPIPEVWWMVKMYEDEGKHIEFFCAMPTGFVDAFKTKFNGHEKWRRSTIEEVPIDEFQLPAEEDTDLFKLQYSRHDIFSLDFDYAKQTTPIRSLMNVSNELNPGESIDLFIRCQSMDRVKWKKVADYAFDQWGKGGMPYRKGIEPIRMIRNIVNVGLVLLHEIFSALQDLMTAVRKTFMHVDQSEEAMFTKEPLKWVNHDREELMIKGGLSNRTTSKRVLPTFKTSMRYAVHSDDAVRRAMISRSVASSFNELKGDNSLESVKINIRSRKELNDLRAWKIVDLDPNLMSNDEVGKLWQLPTSDLQQEYHDAVTSNRRVEIEIPEVFLAESGVLAGTATDRGVIHKIHLPAVNKDLLFTPRAFVGSPRMGKDQAAINLLVELKRNHNIGAIVPDVIDERNGHRGMGDALRDHLEPDDVLDFDMGDLDYSVYLGLQSIVKNVPDLRIAADLIAEEIANFLLADGDEDKYQTFEYLREAAKAVMGDPLGIKLMFMSRQFLRGKIKELDHIFDMDIWTDYDSMADRGTGGKQGQIYGPIMRRIGQIMGSEFLKTMFCQEPNPDMDLWKFIDEGKVVIFRIRIPGGFLPDRVKEILTYWIAMNTFLIRAAMDGKSKSEGTVIVFNEPHQFLSHGLVKFMARMLVEGPKLRLMPLFIFHNFKQFRDYPGFVELLKSSSVNWNLFKNTNSSMYEELFPILSKTFQKPQEAFEATKRFQYIAVWLDGEEYAAPFVCDALPMVGDRYETKDNSFLTKRHIRRYGRPTSEVIKEIQVKNKMIFGSNKGDKQHVEG